MRRIAAIVEGHGEVEAVPILLRRIVQRISPEQPVDHVRPIRVRRHKIVKEGELERAVNLAARRCGKCGCILILLDANSDCPKKLAPKLMGRASKARSDREIRVVLAKVEYEAWFLAAASSLAGSHGIGNSVLEPSDPESIKNAKGWLSSRMPKGQAYRATLHQPALTNVFDLDCARRLSPSFDKLWRDIGSWLETSVQTSP